MKINKLIGKGNTAEVYDIGDERVCKLFYPGYPYDWVKKEYENAVLVSHYDIPVSIVHNIVEFDNRYGITYELARGKSMLDLIMEGQDVNKYVKIFTDIHKRIGSVHIKGITSYKKFLQQNVPESEKDLIESIEKLKEGDILCHGDYHPGNILFNNDRAVVIDFMNVCMGTREYDIARTYFLIGYTEVPDEVPEKETLVKMKKQLADLYLENMGTEYQAIAPYIDIIKQCRAYE